MREKLKTIYRAVDGKVPIVGYLIRKIYYRKPVNTIKKRVIGNGNRIIYRNSILSEVFFDIKGNNNQIYIEKNCLINGVKFFIRGNNHQIHIGANSRFNRGGSLWFEDYNGTLEVGESTTFEDIHIAVTEPNSTVRIGKDCMFAYDIDLRTGDSHSIIDKKSLTRTNFASDITIGNHVWVAAHCIILKGVSIRDGCVVATGSVVVKDVSEEDVIVAGNPAKPVKKGIKWLREKVFLE